MILDITKNFINTKPATGVSLATHIQVSLYSVVHVPRMTGSLCTTTFCHAHKLLYRFRQELLNFNSQYHYLLKNANNTNTDILMRRF